MAEETVVGIRELKAHMSHYLKAVRAGLRVTVTDRGQPVARIIPVDQPEERRIADLSAAGLVQWSGRRFAPEPPVATLSGPKSIAEIVVEERG